MKRYNRSGWFGESHRHYLAAKYGSSKRYNAFMRSPRSKDGMKDPGGSFTEKAIHSVGIPDTRAAEKYRYNPFDSSQKLTFEDIKDLPEEQQDKIIEQYAQDVENAEIIMRELPAAYKENPEYVKTILLPRLQPYLKQ